MKYTKIGHDDIEVSFTPQSMDCAKCGSSMFFKDEVLFDGLDYMNGYYDCLICGEKEYTEVFGLFDSLKEVV